MVQVICNKRANTSLVSRTRHQHWEGKSLFMGHVPCQWCIMVTHHRSRKWKYIRIFDLKMCHQLRICLCCPPPDNVYDSKKITVTYDKIRSKPVEKWEKRPICFGCVLAIWRDNNRQQSIGDSKQMAPTWMLFFFFAVQTPCICQWINLYVSVLMAFFQYVMSIASSVAHRHSTICRQSSTHIANVSTGE